MTLILASSSPRRRELLSELGISFDVRPCALNEPNWRPPALHVRAWAAALAYFKARYVAEHAPGFWTLGADTLVACNDEWLGKPYDLNDARRMLELQAGRATDVVTGVALVRHDETTERRILCETTRVWMKDDAAEREAYLAGGEWSGKAGAYGIQDQADRLVERWEGSFSNVVGLPVETVRRMLAEVMP